MNIPGAGYITYSSYTRNRPDGVTLPGGGKREYVYDPLMRVKSIAAKDPGQNILLNYQYNYDKMDNITAKTTEHGEYDYGYDDLYRLTGADNPVQADEGFTYDAVGNRLTATGVADNWSYNDNNELQGYAGITFEYDANGNMTKKTDAGQVTNYIYNLEDRLTEVWNGAVGSGSLISSYYYDPFGRRLWKEVTGVRTYFVYADEGLVAEVDAAGNVTKSYGYRPGSTWSTDPLFMKEVSEYYFYQNDHIGTPQKLTAVNGAVVWSAKYSSFGEATVEVETIENNLRFPGQYFDQESGLHYNYFRYYNSTTGRYTTTDPIGVQGGINQYIYSLSNPINAFDPTGENSVAVEIFLEILSNLAKYETDKRMKETVDNENERRRKIIEEWSNDISKCYETANRILKKCDNSCIQKHTNDDCKRQNCHMDCYKDEYMTHKNFCRWLEKQAEGLKKPNLRF